MDRYQVSVTYQVEVLARDAAEAESIGLMHAGDEGPAIHVEAVLLTPTEADATGTP